MRQLGSEAMGWDFEDIDITKPEEMGKIIDLSPELIINCAAYNAVDRAGEEYDKAMKLNGYAVGLVAKTGRYLGVPMVHYSTDFVFDGKHHSGYTEDATPEPISFYGASKYLGEKMLQANTDKFYLIRLTGLFGEPGGGKKCFVDARIADSRTKSELAIVYDEYTSPTYAPDLARRTLEIVFNKYPYGIYHGQNEGITSWYDFTRKIFEICGIKSDVVPVSGESIIRPAKRPKYPILINTKLPLARSYEEALGEYLRENGFINHNGQL